MWSGFSVGSAFFRHLPLLVHYLLEITEETAGQTVCVGGFITVEHQFTWVASVRRGRGKFSYGLFL